MASKKSRVSAQVAAGSGAARNAATTTSRVPGVGGYGTDGYGTSGYGV